MARVEGYSDFVLFYKTELKSVVRGHHVYQPVWMDIHCWREPFHCSKQKGRSAQLQ